MPQTTRSEPASVSEQVRAGMLDDEIPRLIEAINDRNAALESERAEAARAQLSVGARVVIGPTASPKYLRGKTGVVHEMRQESVTVCLDHPIGRFTDGHLSCPPQLLRPVGT